MSPVPGPDSRLEELVTVVLQSPRHRHTCPAAVRRIGQAELAKRRSVKDAIKETKNRLHRIGGAYLDAPPPYARWLQTLSAVESPEGWRREVREMMRAHSSTRERLARRDDFGACL